MIRKLPNLSAVMPAVSASRPWKVELRFDRREHVDFPDGRAMRTKETFLCSLVGRYRSASQANAAALRSAKRRGGYMKNHDGVVSPNLPIRRLAGKS